MLPFELPCGKKEPREWSPQSNTSCNEPTCEVPPPCCRWKNGAGANVKWDSVAEESFSQGTGMVRKSSQTCNHTCGGEGVRLNDNGKNNSGPMSDTCEPQDDDGNYVSILYRFY